MKFKCPVSPHETVGFFHQDLCRLSELPRPPRSPGRCALRARRARGVSDDGTDCGASSAGRAGGWGLRLRVIPKMVQILIKSD